MKNILTDKNTSNTIINFMLANNINFKYLDHLKKTIIFYNIADVKKVLSYLYKTNRKFYYLLDSYYLNDKKKRAFKDKIFIEYQNNLFNCSNDIKYYYLSYIL